MSAKAFLELLEQRGLLDETIIADLRRQVDESARSVNAETIAKLLVENEHLTKFQATKLVGESRGIKAAAGAESAGTDMDEELGFKEEDLLAGVPSANDVAGGAEPAEDLLSEVQPVGNAELEPVAEAELEPAQQVEPVAPEVLTPVDEDITALTPAGREDVADDLAKAESTAKKFRKRKKRQNPWDSPLMLAGSGALAVLAILAYIMWRSLTSGTAAELYSAGMDDYRAQAYRNAMDKFEKFQRWYPKNEKASGARVHHEMAALRMVSDSRANPDQSLIKANEVLPKIKEEEAFSEVRDDLATILPDIAEGFAGQANKAKTTSEAEALLKKVDEALVLVNDPEYIPTSLLKSKAPQLTAIKEMVTLVRRGIDRERLLVATRDEIRSAIDTDQTRRAYELRDWLLDGDASKASEDAVFIIERITRQLGMEVVDFGGYPGLENDPRLIDQVSKIGERERSLVKFADQPLALQTARTAEVEGQVVLAGRRGAGMPRATDDTVAILAGGVLYGLNSSDGSMRWRRFVGYQTSFHPAPLENRPEADILAADTQHHELLRLNSKTGLPVWRLPFGEPFNDPVIWRDAILVSTRSGKAYRVNAVSGEARGYADLNQTLDCGPGVDPRRPYMYQVGENDNLYILAQQKLTTAEAGDAVCEEVFYLAHKRGSIRVPPFPAYGHVFVFENAGPGFCFMRILKADPNGLGLQEVQSAIRIEGHVFQSPLAERQRLLVTTDRGAIHVFDVDPQNNPPVGQTIEPVAASGSEQLVGYSLIRSSQLWLGRQGLSVWEVQAAQGRLSQRWSGHRGDIVVAPLQQTGSAVVHARSRSAPGFIVAASKADDPAGVYWQSDLAVPIADILSEGSGQLLVLSRRGALFRITDAELQSRLAAPVFSDTQTGVLYTASLAFGPRRVLVSPAGRALIYDPQRSSTELRSLRLNMPSGQAATQPMAFAGGVLAPLRNGQVMLLNLETGGNLALPFQPELQAGQSVDWRRPALLGPNRFVIADDQRNLYRIALESGRLQVERQRSLDDPIVTPLAALGKTVLAGARYQDVDVILTLSADDLKNQRDASRLEGRIVWGPEVLGDRAFLASDRDGLVCLDAGGEMVWKAPLKYGPVAGAPIEVGGNYVIASRKGVIWRIDRDSGQEQAKIDLAEPLNRAPLLVGNQLIVAGDDGTLKFTPVPGD